MSGASNILVDTNLIILGIVQLRKKNKTKLPDAIIAASSITKKLPLFTADKGFAKIPGLNIVLF